MRGKIIRCDLCTMEGRERTAVAKYRDVIGEKWNVCREHLELVKETGLEYQILVQEANSIKDTKTLREIHRLATLALSDIIDAQEYWSVGETAEIESLESIQAKLQAILRNADEALEANDEG